MPLINRTRYVAFGYLVLVAVTVDANEWLESQPASAWQRLRLREIKRTHDQDIKTALKLAREL